MKKLLALIIFIIWGILIQPYAATLEPSLEEYTFASGLLHGVSWFILLVVKWFNKSIVVFADYHTSGYTVGFVIGIFVSIVILIRVLTS